MILNLTKERADRCRKRWEKIMCWVYNRAMPQRLLPLLFATTILFAAKDQVLDFEDYAGILGSCDGPVGTTGTTCTWVANGFTFKYLGPFWITNNAFFPNIDNNTQFLVPSYIPELQPGVPEKPLIIEFEKPVKNVSLDVHLGSPLSAALVRAIGVNDEIIAATHVLTDMRISFEGKGRRRLKRLELGITSTRVIAAFGIDNIAVDRGKPGIE